MIVLGIETTCDETAVAIVDDKRKIYANELFSQVKEHERYGGVMPEVASRKHSEILPILIEQALKTSSMSFDDIDGVAVTGGPGLIGGVMVGVVYAKTIASLLNKQLIAINHLEGHALTVRLTDEIGYPYLLLLISGGHCQIVVVKDLGQYEILSTTIDDAVGEAFDKTAKILGLGYPGGPEIERLAQKGDISAYRLPTPLNKKEDLNFSFSGLKTAARNLILNNDISDEKVRQDICASFQHTVGKILTNRVKKAIEICHRNNFGIHNVVMSGGVAANQYIKTMLADVVAKQGCDLFSPPVKFCTDNAAMIAWAGIERLQRGFSTPLNFQPRSRWLLNEIYYDR